MDSPNGPAASYRVGGGRVSRPSDQGGRAGTAGVLGGLVAFAILALAWPDADPGTFLPGLDADRAREMLVEPAAKAHEARNHGLFGEFHRNPADEYQFWRAQSPVWVWPLALTFGAFGVSYPVLRGFSVAVAIVGLMGMVGVGRRLLPAPVLGGITLITCTSLYVVEVGRSGLIEGMTATAAVWTVFFLLRTRDHPGWAVAAQGCFTLGLFAKQGIVYVFPLLVVCQILAFARWRRDGTFPRLRWLPVAVALVLAAGSAAWMLQPSYLRAVLWNANHLLVGADEPIPWTDRLLPVRQWWTWIVMPGGAGLVAVPTAIGLGVAAVRRRTTWEEAVVLGWFASTALAVLLLRLWTVRYASVLLLPTFLVAGIGLARAWATPMGRRIVIAWIAGSLALNAGLQALRARSVEHSVADTREAVERAIGDRPAVVIGALAMPVLLASPYDVYYVKYGFNRRSETIVALGVTHALIGPEERTLRWLRKAGCSARNPVPVGGELVLHEVQCR